MRRWTALHSSSFALLGTPDDERSTLECGATGIGASGIFRMEYSFPLAGVLAATAVGLIFGVIAALFPARQAARMEIIKALRYE